MLSPREEDSPFLIWLPPSEAIDCDRRTEKLFTAQDIQEQFENGEAHPDDVLDAIAELGWEPLSYLNEIEEALRKGGIQ